MLNTSLPTTTAGLEPPTSSPSPMSKPATNTTSPSRSTKSCLAGPRVPQDSSYSLHRIYLIYSHMSIAKVDYETRICLFRIQDRSLVSVPAQHTYCSHVFQEYLHHWLLSRDMSSPSSRLPVSHSRSRDRLPKR